MTHALETSPVEIDPHLFYNLVDLMQSVDPGMQRQLEDTQEHLATYQSDLAEQVRALQESCRHVAVETRRMTRRRQEGAVENPLEEDFSTSQSFLGLVLNIASATNSAMQSVVTTAAGLRPGRLILRKERFDGAPSDFTEVQHMVMEFQMNLPSINRFVSSLSELMTLKTRLVDLVHVTTESMEQYRKRVQHRHSAEGIEIHKSVVATDVAISIYENVDGHGEIEDGKSPDEVSAYSVRRAMAMAEGVRNGLVNLFITEPDKFVSWLEGNLRAVWEFVDALEKLFEEAILQAQVSIPRLRKVHPSTEAHFDNTLHHLRDVDPNAVVHREKSVLLTPEERWHLNFRNRVLKEIVEMLCDTAVSSEETIRYILKRKHELHSYFQDENSFYVCRIGKGNSFLGEAPGSLQVIPGTRPSVNLDEIFGSGYDEVRHHAAHIDATAKWHDLFVATSPSKSADKSNVLMVGPMGCGKSQVLRGVGSHRGSLAIFAVGSDFNTCWAGEAQKNPKRLFEAAVRLEKESRKHVHILIDEIDSVLNDDLKPGSSNFNLRLEFQILMDGVVHYPRITVWGATNNIERIPMPMIRRFAKVVIVGELDQDDRVRTLQHYASTLPIGNYSDAAWETQAAKLAGATGDVIRKVVDHVWREKMTHFVENHAKEAEVLLRWLNSGTKFSIAEFSSRRAEFHKLLGEHVVLTPADIDRSIEIALDNVGIYHEIETAKDTYEGARRFLAQVRATRGAS